MRRGLALLLVVGLLPGCALAIPLAVDLAGTSVGIYQRYQDRQVQGEQNEEIKRLREEIAATRQQLHDDLLRLIPPP